ncbi:coiled-coil domain-containing protein 77-like [Argopecten irradians]
MTKRLALMNQRYQDLERRRNLEVEGFKNDIKNLRSRLKDVERQLYKVTMGFAEDMDMKRPDDIDMQILRNVHATAGRSKKIVGELKNLKAKMYGIENNLKHL